MRSTVVVMFQSIPLMDVVGMPKSSEKVKIQAFECILNVRFDEIISDVIVHEEMIEKGSQKSPTKLKRSPKSLC
jgi:hypothetical protein